MHAGSSLRLDFIPFQDAVAERLRIAVVGRTNFGRQDQIALQVDDVLGLVRQMRPTVF